jgi:hypothetical protein
MSKDQSAQPDSACIQRMQAQIDEMKCLLAQAVQASCIENVMQQGFDRISTCLEPLRDMSEPREFPKPEAVVAFSNMLLAIEQPKWSGVDYKAEVISDPCQRSSKP